jgi:hypothetical protein
MKLYIKFLALFILILMNKPTWSQAFPNRSVSLAANHNFATNGFNTSYHWENKHWEFATGLFFIVNTFQWNENKQGHLNYQTGFSANIAEHFGFQGAINRRIWTWSRVQFNANFKVLTTFNGIKFKDYGSERQVLYYNPALNFEFTVGSNIQYQISNKCTLSATAGVGYFYSPRSTIGKNLSTGTTVGVASFHESPFSDFVGFDGLPTLQVALKYRLGNR